MKQRTPLQLKKEREAEATARYSLALAKARAAERENDLGRRKRKDEVCLLQFLNDGARNRDVIRRSETFQARTYNLGRQVLSLIDHRFVQYQTPFFLYRSLLTRDGMREVFGAASVPQGSAEEVARDARYAEWFFAVAQGGSLVKLTADEMTRKETHAFLGAPEQLTIEQSVWWAKLVAAGLVDGAARTILQRFLLADLRRLGDRTEDLIRFYGRHWQEMGSYERFEVTDYLREAIHDATFSLKGRTLSSVRKMAAEWHRWAFRRSLTWYVTWQVRFPVWLFADRGCSVRAVELTSNHALADEGGWQRHCVYGYWHSCRDGHRSIVSVRWYGSRKAADGSRLEVNRLTIEVMPSVGAIVQIRGRGNRIATPEEMTVVRHWAGDNGLIISGRC